MKIHIKHTRNLEGEYGCQVCLADANRPMITVWCEGSARDGIATICRTCVLAMARVAQKAPPAIAIRRVATPRKPSDWAMERQRGGDL